MNGRTGIRHQSIVKHISIGERERERGGKKEEEEEEAEEKEKKEEKNNNKKKLHQTEHWDK
jgi:hypothetical protein